MMLEKLERLLGICRNFIKIAADYIPEYKTDGSACFDIQSSCNYTFNTNDLHVVGTGIRCEIPKGWCLLIFARSSLGLKRLIIPNSVGVIDSDYRGEIKVPLIYLGTDPLVIEKGQRIAQGMLIESRKARFIKTTKLSDTSRGDGGFGSTGDK
jgi:dUTP pyrophosphatase